MLDRAYTYMEKEKAPFALLVKKQTFEKRAATHGRRRAGQPRLPFQSFISKGI